MTFNTGDPEKTMAFGAVLARRLAVGDCILLDGPLGVGKTTLVRGMMRELGIAGPVRSPTYNLVHEYHTSPPVAHADLYRLSTGDEVATLGLEELLSRSVLVLEWPDRAPAVLPKDALVVRMEFAADEARKLALRAGGPQSAGLLSYVRGDLEAAGI